MVPVPTGPWTEATLKEVVDSFHTAHERRFGMKAEDERVECVVFRVRAILDLPKHSVKAVAKKNRVAVPTGTRDAVFSAKIFTTKLYHRNELQPGDMGDGPAIINEYDTTTVVYPYQRFHIDQFKNIIIETAPS